MDRQLALETLDNLDKEIATELALVGLFVLCVVAALFAIFHKVWTTDGVLMNANKTRISRRSRAMTKLRK